MSALRPGSALRRGKVETLATGLHHPHGLTADTDHLIVATDDGLVTVSIATGAAALQRLAGTIRQHKQGILAYVRSGLSNGRTEALNGKARTITRRAYGLHSASALIALLRLCCSGIELHPVTRRARGTHYTWRRAHKRRHRLPPIVPVSSQQGRTH